MKKGHASFCIFGSFIILLYTENNLKTQMKRSTYLFNMLLCRLFTQLFVQKAANNHKILHKSDFKY